MVLVMTVNPGFGGQDYIATMEPKVRQVRQMVLDGGYDCDVEVDGGISPSTVRAPPAPAPTCSSPGPPCTATRPASSTPCPSCAPSPPPPAPPTTQEP